MRIARTVGMVMAGGMAMALAACASVVGSTESEVQIRTNPDNAHCDLSGYEGFAASVETPAAISIPNVAAPVTVTCRAPGFRPTSYTLNASADGWIWGNSALFLASGGGVAILGALVDESRAAGKSYAEEVHYQLSPDRPRPVRARSRDGGTDLNLQAR
ncbi:hypothetical protein [Magnetospirillum aberrantis]|uniref:Uncharacterized protein n=1 Tax=Magnetospirillum aberrantis SpK TaxID=908842 RepID=A0A7C9UXM7_9PROT|nr:hypothetical protein [Magnetospirillum aberrantis]NFV79153.1 hypothetical protein [Magnetospirillum aberrantis SpK]